jgi:hypothetical protein
MEAKTRSIIWQVSHNGVFSIFHWYSNCLHGSMKCNNFHLKILSLFSLIWWNVNLSISLIQIVFPSFCLHFMKPVGCSLIFLFIMFGVLYISCELQSCSFFLEFSLHYRWLWTLFYFLQKPRLLLEWCKNITRKTKNRNAYTFAWQFTSLSNSNRFLSSILKSWNTLIWFSFCFDT